MRTPAYRERLRVEGAALAAAGLLAAIAVLIVADDAADGPRSTVIQLGIVALLMITVGTRSVRKSMQRATSIDPGATGSGEPTPIWSLPLIVAGLALAFGFGAGWDAALRVGGGCVIIGCAQAILFERLVAAEELRSAKRFYRMRGSSVFTGTRLGAVRRVNADRR